MAVLCIFCSCCVCEKGEGRRGCRGGPSVGHYPGRGILNWPRQTATATPDEVTMGQGHWGHNLSSAPDKWPVWPSLELECCRHWSQVSLRCRHHLQWGVSAGVSKRASFFQRTSVVAPLYIFIRKCFMSACESTKWVNQMFLYRMSYSAVLFTVRSSWVCQDIGSPNSMVICMFPWYILDWLSNLKPLLSWKVMQCDSQDEKNLFSLVPRHPLQ